MIAEFGVFALILALFFAVLLVLVPTYGILRQKPQWCITAPYYAVAQFFCIACAYLCLTYCFLTNDFSVRYVLVNSSLALPWFYKLCALWGGHEGSMLLWVAILNVWTLAVARFSRQLDLAMRTRVLVVLGGLSIGFILFLLLTSNPFLRQFEILNSPGRDLNPLLQDPGFLFHPPMLYMGYVGFAVAFAFAIAALWYGRVEASWAKWTRPWTLAAWCCLTAGITLGSWWAYRELGWGGWWFWDPVENASFMPWLVGTALLHSLAVTEQRQQFLAWTLLLAISAFALSLIGTFLVRSGVLTSVHAFAVDPARGLYILAFLGVVIGGALLLFSWRGAAVRQNSTGIALVARESALLLNNVFLTVTMLTVLMGTVYPLLIDGLGLGKLSVGAPYFNTVFVPLMLPVLVLMGVGIHLRWHKDQPLRVLKQLLTPLGLSLLLPFFLLWSAPHFNPAVYLGLSLACWIILSTALAWYQRQKQRGWRQITQAFYGMLFAHWGVAISVIGIAVSVGYGVQDDVKLAPDQTTTLAGFHIKFIAEQAVTGPNYRGTQAQFAVTKHEQTHIIYPEKRFYTVANMPMTEAAIDVSPFRDIYIALGEPLDEHAWSVRLYYKPCVRWIWAGGFLILTGGFLALSDRRYYTRRRHISVQAEIEV